jgi:hypothetical protein
MIQNAKKRKDRQQELEAFAKSQPENVAELFRRYYPEVAVPEVGGLMIQSIVAHEFDLEPTLFQG